MAPRDQKRFSMDVFVRDLETLGESEDYPMPADGAVQTLSYVLTHPEMLSAILFRFVQANTDNAIPQLDAFAYSLTVTVLNGNTLTPTVYPVIMDNRYICQKIPAAGLITRIDLQITAPPGANAYTADVLCAGQRAYDVSATVAGETIEFIVDAPEDDPLAVEDIDTLTEDTIASITLNDVSLSDADRHLLFDKHYDTGAVSIPAGGVLAAFLKMPFEVVRMKPIADDNQVIGELEWDATDDEGVHHTGFGKMDAEFQLSSFTLTNNTENNIDLAEIVILRNKPVQTTAPERRPLNTNPLGELVAEDVTHILVQNLPELTNTQIALLFDKHTDTGTVELGPESLWLVVPKMSKRVKRIKCLGADNIAIPLQYVVTDVDDVDHTYTEFATGEEPANLGVPVAQIDYEVAKISIQEVTGVKQDIAEIVIEVFQDVEQFLQLDGPNYYAYDDGSQDEDPIPLTDAFVEFEFSAMDGVNARQITPQSWDLSNDEEDDADYIEWSWDGTNVAGRLLPGETYHEDTHHRSVWLRGEAAGSLYRMWAR